MHPCRSNVQQGYTALIWAAGNVHLDIADLLLKAGADKDAQDKVSESAKKKGTGLSVLLCFPGLSSSFHLP